MTTPPEPGTEPPTEAPPEVDKESFGTWLRRQRELREITLREIADTSKISLRYLQALEEDRFDLLPAPVFAKGFLRQYARYVGLDPEETVNFFLDARGQKEEESVEVTPKPQRSGPTWSYAAVALVVALLLMALVWGLLRLNQEGTVPPGDGSPDAAAEATPVRTGADAEVPGAGDEAAPAPADAAAPAAEAAPPPSTAPPTPIAPLVVTLDFRGNCWVRAAVDGRFREARVYTQGESLQLPAEGQVSLELGNVFEVVAEVNGWPFALHDGSGPEVRRISIDLETAAALAAAAAADDGAR